HSSWRAFLRTQATSVLGCDFLTVETAFLQRIYVLFFISLATRRVEYIACSSSPDGRWEHRPHRALRLCHPTAATRRRSPRPLPYAGTTFSAASSTNTTPPECATLRPPAQARLAPCRPLWPAARRVKRGSCLPRPAARDRT